MNRSTSIIQKLLASVVNALFVIAISLPFYFYFGLDFRYKFSVVIIFFFYEQLPMFTKNKRDLGMLVVDSHWKVPFSTTQYFIYNIFYTLSFSTLMFYIWFPFDLLLLNLLILQTCMIHFTGRTLHGYISNMQTIHL